MKANKYKAQKTRIDGLTFASKGEASCYEVLKNDPEIEILQTQPQVYLTAAKILYKPDFKCKEKKTGLVFYVEYKGVETASWRIKKKLWKSYGPSFLQIFKGSYNTGIKMVEEIKPVRKYCFECS